MKHPCATDRPKEYRCRTHLIIPSHRGRPRFAKSLISTGRTGARPSRFVSPPPVFAFAHTSSPQVWGEELATSPPFGRGRIKEGDSNWRSKLRHRKPTFTLTNSSSLSVSWASFPHNRPPPYPSPKGEGSNQRRQSDALPCPNGHPLPHPAGGEFFAVPSPPPQSCLLRVSHETFRFAVPRCRGRK